MFALIKREIEDSVVYFLGAVVLSAILISVLISIGYHHTPAGSPAVAIGVLLPVIIMGMLGPCAMGAAQMYTDKTRKISSFLSTLVVTRAQILIARIITGILSILTVLVPLIVTAVILLRIFAPPVPGYGVMVFEISITIFLMGFACYCIGLQTGWNSNKIIPTMGGLVLTCTLVPLVLVKGFGLHIIVILSLLIIASLTRTWQKFMSTSL